MSAQPRHPPSESEPEPGPDLRLVEKREHTLLSLIELSHELRVSSDLRGTADLVLLNLMGHFGATRAAIWLIGESEPRSVDLVRAYGISPATSEALGAALAAAFSERFAASSSLVRLEELPEESRSAGTRQAIACGIELVAPVAAHGILLGMLALGGRLGRQRYGTIEQQYVGAAAGLAGTALENNRLYRRVLETNRQLRDANDHLTEMDALRTEMIQNVNHELRTPLSIILGYLEPMPDDAGLPERNRKALAVVIRQAQKLARLVENLFDFSGSASGGLELENIDADPRPILQALAERRGPAVVDGQRRFDCDLAPDLPRARFDPRRLGQVIHLLIDNAVKFTPPGARVQLTARALDEDGRRWLEIQVEDDGPGIPPELREHLFEPFRQGDGSTTRRAGGMGLGLALVAAIVRRMEGSVDAPDASAPGARIRIRLPACP